MMWLSHGWEYTCCTGYRWSFDDMWGAISNDVSFESWARTNLKVMMTAQMLQTAGSRTNVWDLFAREKNGQES